VSAGVALLAGSLWALLALPLEWALLRWGAVLPEERYLSAKFGDSYAEYLSRVRRWV
jgi:protein-S-isoprenylcysteine O-methyltransferase Ste14